MSVATTTVKMMLITITGKSFEGMSTTTISLSGPSPAVVLALTA